MDISTDPFFCEKSLDEISKEPYIPTNDTKATNYLSDSSYSNITKNNITLISKLETKTSNGVLSKGWYSINGEMCLVKGNSYNPKKRMFGYEPFSEVIASRLAIALGLNSVRYDIMYAKLFPEITCYDIDYVSVCKNYLSESAMSYKFLKYCKTLEKRNFINYWQWIHETGIFDLTFIYTMLLFDAFIGNEDRHLNNWDIIKERDKTYFAPLIDFGASLLAWRSDVELERIVNMSDTSIGYDNAKPFKDSHMEQVKLIRNYKKIDISLGRNFSEIRSIVSDTLLLCDDILSLMEPIRRKCILKYLNARLGVLEVLV